MRLRKDSKLEQQTQGEKPVEKKTRKKPAKRYEKNCQSERFSYFIYKVLKQVHPDSGISKKAMMIMESFVNDMFDKIAVEAARLAKFNNAKTLSSRDVQSAVRLLIPGELSSHAIMEGSKAITKYFTKS